MNYLKVMHIYTFPVKANEEEHFNITINVIFYNLYPMSII